MPESPDSPQVCEMLELPPARGRTEARRRAMTPPRPRSLLPVFKARHEDDHSSDPEQEVPPHVSHWRELEKIKKEIEHLHAKAQSPRQGGEGGGWGDEALIERPKQRAAQPHPSLELLRGVVARLYYSQITAGLYLATMVLAALLLCITLGMETPLRDAPRALLFLEGIITLSLVVEVILRAIVQGRNYLKSWWNAVDGSLAVLSSGLFFFAAPRAAGEAQKEDVELSQSLVMARVIFQFVRVLRIASLARRASTARGPDVSFANVTEMLEFTDLEDFDFTLLKQETDAFERIPWTFEAPKPQVVRMGQLCCAESTGRQTSQGSIPTLQSKPTMLADDQVSDISEAELLRRTSANPFAGHVAFEGPFCAEDAHRAGFFSILKPPDEGEEVVCFQRNHWLKRGIVEDVDFQVSTGEDGLMKGVEGAWVKVKQQENPIFHSWAAFLSTSSDHEPGNQVGEQQRNPEGQRYSSLCLQAEYEASNFYALRKEMYGSTVTHETRVTKAQARASLESWLAQMIDADGEAVEISPEMAKELLDIFDVQQDASLHLYSLHKRLGPRTDVRKGRDYSLYYQALNNTLNHDTEASLRAALPLIRRMTYLLLYEESTGTQRLHKGGTVWKGDSERPARAPRGARRMAMADDASHAFQLALEGLKDLKVKCEVINGNGSEPRFDLFHFEWSICSWKTRIVLMEKGVPWRSWTLDPRAHSNYAPAYVRLRSLGTTSSTKLVGEVYNGSTSSESQGFDPLVDLAPELRKLYEAKKKKTELAKSAVGKLSGLKETYRAMLAKVDAMLLELEADLRKTGGPYVCGTTCTMADLVWHCSLLRLYELGFEDHYAQDAQ
eukprot:g26270.t1